MYDKTFSKNDQIDFNDTLFVRERLPSSIEIIEQIPAPISIFKDGEHKGKEKINPHISRFNLSNGKTIELFHIKPIYYLHKDGGWRPMSEIASRFGNKSISLKEDWADKMDMRYLSWLLKRANLLVGNVYIPSPFSKEFVTLSENLGSLAGATIHFTTDTFYPDANPESTTVDGKAYWFNTSSDGTTWGSTAHPATDGTGSDDTSSSIYLQVYHRSGSNLGIDRAFFLFDTSSIADGATISDAVLSLYTDGKDNAEADGKDYFSVVQTTPASNTAITTADFDQCGAITNPTKGSNDVDVDTITTNQYFDLTLNATGRGWISKTGVTKLGVREGHDIENEDPNGGGDGVYIHLYCAEYTGSTRDPKLAVTYSTSVDVTVSATVLSATFSIPAYTPTAIRNVTVSPSVLSATFSLPSSTIMTSVSVAPSVLSATFSIPAYTIQIADTTVYPSPLTATFSTPAPTITTTRFIDVLPNTLSATFSVPSFTPTGTSGITVTIGTVLSAVFSTPSPTITTTRTIVVSVDPIAMLFSIPSHFTRGDFWQEKYSTPATSWSDKFGGGSNSWSDKY